MVKFLSATSYNRIRNRNFLNMALVRMLNMSRWDHDCIKKGDLYHGDAISDLKCNGNTLSVWIANNSTEIQEAVLALALGRDAVQKMTIILLDEAILKENYNIKISNTPGNVPIVSLQPRHRDLSDIDFWNLGFVAEHIGKLLNNSSNYQTYSKNQVEKIILDAIRNQLLTPNMLNSKLKENLGF